MYSLGYTHKKIYIYIYSFPYRRIEIWNNLDAEVVHARNINEFKAKLDNKRYGDGTV